MKKAIVVVMALSLYVLMFSAMVAAEEGAVHQYIGSAKCKTCHNAEAKGAQYVKWSESKHAKAFEVLASEKALELGKAQGVENPQTSDKCLKCHVTAFGAAAEAKAESFDQSEGIGCETCHGPGSDYKKMTVMKDLEAAKAAGLIVPDEKTCVKCHNDQSPTFKEFNFETAYKAIAHPKPAKAE